MHWIDWCITVIPVLLVLAMAVWSRRYVRGVVDYLAAGRVAGRYVLAVGDMASGLSVIFLVALVEAKYQTGYALAFWENLVAPVGIVISLTGYCLYRFRETKALSIGQFLEMRYNRPFRIFASALRTVADTMTNAIAPAVAANFFIYFLDLPHKVEIFGLSVPCFAIILFCVLLLAMIVIWPGGRISLIITDCFQGLMSYPIFVVIVGYVLVAFSWDGEMAPVLADRAAGESFLNPFDIRELRDFNIFALVVTIVGSILNRASWIGNDSTSAGRTPHEQKMGGILGAWRNGFSLVMCALVAVVVLTIMNHEKFAPQALEIRQELTRKIAEETVTDSAKRALLITGTKAIGEQRHKIGSDSPLSLKKNLDTPYMDAAEDVLCGNGEGNFVFQKFRSLYYQMIMPVALRKMLPVGMMGIFCLMMVMLMVSTDDSRIMNCSCTIVQDLILPLLKNPPTPKGHLLLLRLASCAIAVVFFCCSFFFVQLDYINMFITIMTSVWLGGAGPVMIFGLYSRFGNTAGAFSSLIFGSGTSIAGLVLQRNWADVVYPFLLRHGGVEPVGNFLHAVSAPFSPYIIWEMDAVKFPVNSMEIYFLSMFFGCAAYVAVSLLTCRKPFNLDRLLHRGEYAKDGEKRLESAWTWRNVWSKLIGITPEYTTGDKIIAWSVFAYSFVFQVGICFVGVLILNAFSPWPPSYWAKYFYHTQISIVGIIGVVSTFWFLIGGSIDLKRLFRDLAKRVDNPLDDGRVEGGVSLADLSHFQKLDAEDGEKR